MENSNLSEEAQAIKLCDLCQEDKVKWRCIDCNMCLCAKCKTFHLRVPATAQHQIITISTPLEDVQRKIFINNIPCKNHETQVMCLFCETCDCLVCPDCISSNHMKHYFIPMKTVLGQKLDKIKRFETEINENFHLCESKSKKATNLKSKYNTVLDTSVIKIKQREKELKDKISLYSNLLLDKVEDQRSKLNMTVSKIEETIDQTKPELEGLKHKVDTLLTTNQGQVIFDADIKVSDSEYEDLPEDIEHFIPGEDTPQQIQELFGSLHGMTIQHDVEFEVVKTVTTDLTGIFSLKVRNLRSLWISDVKDKVIRISEIYEGDIITSKEIHIKAADIAIVSKDDILVSEFESSDIKLLKRSGEINMFLSVAPLLPRGIHVTNNKNVIVCVRELTDDDPYILTDKSQRAVVEFGMDGTQKNWYEYDKDRNRLFTCPYRVRTNHKHDIIVVDKLSGQSGRIVVLDKTGDLKWVYEKHGQINSTFQFDPRDIVLTSEGNIVVCDFKTNALHTLSTEGVVLACKRITDLGIIKPIALDLDKLGQLWVGCFSECKKIKSKLHIVKLLW